MGLGAPLEAASRAGAAQAPGQRALGRLGGVHEENQQPRRPSLTIISIHSLQSFLTPRRRPARGPTAAAALPTRLNPRPGAPPQAPTAAAALTMSGRVSGGALARLERRRRVAPLAAVAATGLRPNCNAQP